MMTGNPERWTTEFSIDVETEEWASRRNFLRILSLVSGGFAAANSVAFLRPLLTDNRNAGGTAVGKMALCHAEELHKGDWRVFLYPDHDHPAILIRRLNGEYLAYAQKCPHLSCPVTYQCEAAQNSESLVCHCHNGRFDLASGKGVAGPPRELRALTRIAVLQEQGIVWAVGQIAQDRHDEA